MWGWVSAGQCPRPAHLALFWVSRWGVSIIHAEAHNEAKFHAAHAAALKRENAALVAQVAALSRLTAGAANAPLFTWRASSSQTGLVGCALG